MDQLQGTYKTIDQMEQMNQINKENQLFETETASLKRQAEDEGDSDTEPVRRNGKRKIEIKYIEDKARRHITFSKRKAGIMKKAYELSTLTGTEILLLISSSSGNGSSNSHCFTFSTPKLQKIITGAEGKALIQSCLNPETVPYRREDEDSAVVASQNLMQMNYGDHMGQYAMGHAMMPQDPQYMYGQMQANEKN